MGQNFKKFIDDVYEKININKDSNFKFDSDTKELIVKYRSGTLIVRPSDIEPYYKTYIMSHQERSDAIERAAFYLNTSIENWIKKQK